MDRLLAAQGLLNAGIGGLAGAAVMGLNPLAGSAMALTAFAIDSIALSLYEKLNKNSSTNLEGIIKRPFVFLPSLILTGSVFHAILKVSAATLPLFHAYVIAKVCRNVADIIWESLVHYKYITLPTKN